MKRERDFFFNYRERIDVKTDKNPHTIGLHKKEEPKLTEQHTF